MSHIPVLFLMLPWLLSLSAVTAFNNGNAKKKPAHQIFILIYLNFELSCFGGCTSSGKCRHAVG